MEFLEISQEQFTAFAAEKRSHFTNPTNGRNVRKTWL